MTETYHHHEAMRRTVLAARLQLAVLAPPTTAPTRTARRQAPIGKRPVWRAFVAESFAAAGGRQDCTLVPTAGLPELHGLIEQLRPHYSEDTIAGLLLIVAEAEARLARTR
jgi:hypothetical protein